MCYRDVILYCDVRVKQQRWHNCPQRQDQAALNEKHICHREFKEFEPNPFQLSFREWNVNMAIQDLGILLVFWHHRKKNFHLLDCVVFIMKSSLFWRSNMYPKESAFLKSAMILLASPEKYLPSVTMACHTGTLEHYFLPKTNLASILTLWKSRKLL